MDNSLNFDYFYEHEAEMFVFYQIPQALFMPYFKRLSAEAKLLYGLLLNRNSLSRKNGWIDDNGRVYIIFTREEAMEKLCISSETTISNIFKELNKFGLIEEKRRGLGMANIIFVKNFIFKPEYLENQQNPKKCSSVTPKNEAQGLQKMEGSNTYSSNTYTNKKEKFTKKGKNTTTTKYLQETGIYSNYEDDTPDNLSEVFENAIHTNIAREFKEALKENRINDLIIPDDKAEPQQQNQKPLIKMDDAQVEHTPEVKKCANCSLKSKALKNECVSFETILPEINNCITDDENQKPIDSRTVSKKVDKQSVAKNNYPVANPEKVIFDNKTVNEIKKMIESKISGEMNFYVLRDTLLPKYGLEKINYTLNNWNFVDTLNKENEMGLFVSCVMKGIHKPEAKKAVYQNSTCSNVIPQHVNFKQREYSEEEIEQYYAD